MRRGQPEKRSAIAVACGVGCVVALAGCFHDRGLAIPAGGARVVLTSLTAAAAVVPTQTDTKDLSEDRVLVWTKQTPPSSCVVVEHWDHGQLTRDFVVPEEDPDCDDVAAPECNPAA